MVKKYSMPVDQWAQTRLGPTQRFTRLDSGPQRGFTAVTSSPNCYWTGRAEGYRGRRTVLAQELTLKLHGSRGLYNPRNRGTPPGIGGNRGTPPNRGTPESGAESGENRGTPKNRGRIGAESGDTILIWAESGDTILIWPNRGTRIGGHPESGDTIGMNRGESGDTILGVNRGTPYLFQPPEQNSWVKWHPRIATSHAGYDAYGVRTTCLVLTPSFSLPFGPCWLSLGNTLPPRFQGHLLLHAIGHRSHA